MSWDNDSFWIVAIAFGALFALLAYWSARREEQRRRALEQLAGSRGLVFSREDPIGIPGAFAQFELFQRGDVRYAHDVIHGAIENRNYCACDFQYTRYEYYTDHQGRPRRRDVTIHCSAAIAELNHPVPALWLRPENFLDKAARLVGFHDVEFESDQFNREFHVKAVNREIAFDILNARTMERLLANPFRRIEFNGAAVLIFEEDTWTPEQFAAALDLARQLAEGVPNYLFEKLRERTRS